MKTMQWLVPVGVLIGLLLLPNLIGWQTGYQLDGQDLPLGATPPSWRHWFGTDFLGRDLLLRTACGMRISLLVALVASSTAAVIGIGYGLVAAAIGGMLAEAMLRFLDILSVLPYLFVVITLVAILGNHLVWLFLVLGLFGWMGMARVVRAQTLQILQCDFIDAARVCGRSEWFILWRHVLPNLSSSIVVLFTLQTPQMVIEEAFLSFIGCGISPPQASLGSLIAQGSEHMGLFDWELWFPSVVLALLLLGLLAMARHFERSLQST